ncbi:type VI secretion system baseplate subunit TssG [Acinetobacter sp. ANC 4779]|uniref:type VI secretion system baseplate subunit TssG n=1 Tax=Acinetobacter sp. ANC 4779 TaxID=2529848 RepID=UPI00103C8FD1|nr:type VI secretion system baseplate subunit TssG [Acinetobacter sp. ANC 4779]TCB50757.1 type VI secretion system baseplate subunit TssG [Acinetobacter sp. ANC 4779]
MRAERWWQEASVIDDLMTTPTAYEFIQATRLLRHVPNSFKTQYWANDFKFHSSLNLNFPVSEIETLKLENKYIHFTNLIVGLTGMQGALPYTYSHKIKHGSRQQKVETINFLGLFNHKLTAQYVDASLTYHLPVRYEIEQENDYLDILHALNGYVSSQQDQAELDDYFAEFSGLMQGQNNTTYALRTMLECIFKKDFEIKEFIEEKFKLTDEQKTTLGGLSTSLLGMNTFCGESIRQIDEKIEIQIGPLSKTDYLSFLPQQKMSEKLKKILTIWCSPTLMVDLRLILKKEDIQPLCLNSSSQFGLAQGAFLMPKLTEYNSETCYALLREI